MDELEDDLLAVVVVPHARDRDEAELPHEAEGRLVRGADRREEPADAGAARPRAPPITPSPASRA